MNDDIKQVAPEQAPETKPACDVVRGDYVWSQCGVREVRHVEMFTEANDDGARQAQVLLVFAGAGLETQPADELVRLATEADVAAVQAGERRDQFIDAFQVLTDLFQARQLPVPRHSVDVRAMLRNEAEVRDFAARLGASVEEATDRNPYVSAEWAWPPNVPSYERLIELRFNAHRDEEKTSAEVSTPPAAVQEGTPARSGPVEGESAGPDHTNSPMGRDPIQAVATAGPSGRTTPAAVAARIGRRSL